MSCSFLGVSQKAKGPKTVLFQSFSANLACVPRSTLCIITDRCPDASSLLVSSLTGPGRPGEKSSPFPELSKESGERPLPGGLPHSALLLFCQSLFSKVGFKCDCTVYAGKPEWPYDLSSSSPPQS